MKAWWLIALVSIVLLTALLLPLASPDPDGLNKVAQDQGFQDKETPALAQQLPFAQIFDSYALRGVENPFLAQSLAGAGGILIVFGSAWGLGWWLKKRRHSP